MKKKDDAKRIAEAWQTLYYAGILNDKESERIWKKIKAKYGKELKLITPSESE